MLDRATVRLVRHRRLEWNAANGAVWQQELFHFAMRVGVAVLVFRRPIVQVAQQAELRLHLIRVHGGLELVLCCALGHAHLGQPRLLLHAEFAEPRLVAATVQVIVVFLPLCGVGFDVVRGVGDSARCCKHRYRRVWGLDRRSN